MKRFLIKIFPGMIIVIIWQLITIFNDDLEFFIGSPIGILNEFDGLIRNENLGRDFFVTFIEAFSGFLLGTIIGSFLGLVLWFSKTAYEISKPYLIIASSIPVFALGPIIIFWFGTGIASKIFLSFLATLIIAIIQAYTGTLKVDSNLINLVKTLGGNRIYQFRKIVAPSTVIWILTGLKINIGMALLGAFIGEFISSQEGLGHMIIVAEGLFNVNQIWVGIIGIVILALIFNGLIHPIELKAKKFIN